MGDVAAEARRGDQGRGREPLGTPHAPPSALTAAPPARRRRSRNVGWVRAVGYDPDGESEDRARARTNHRPRCACPGTGRQSTHAGSRSVGGAALLRPTTLRRRHDTVCIVSPAGARVQRYRPCLQGRVWPARGTKCTAIDQPCVWARVLLGRSNDDARGAGPSPDPRFRRDGTAHSHADRATAI